MNSPIKKSLREGMIEMQGLDIPYNAVGFAKWLTVAHQMSLEDAEHQVRLIREADIELWEPEDPEIFLNISSWINDARNAKSEIVREMLYDFVFITLKTQIEYLQELDKDIKKSSKPFLNSVLEAYKYYFAFMSDLLVYSQERLDSLFEEDENDEENDLEESTVRYAPLPLDSEYNRYLIESRFSNKTRYKMMTNLRKLNHYIINNGRGDSNWLQRLIDEVKSGISIRRARPIAHKMVHAAIENIDETDDITIDALRGGLTSINHYLDFLIRTYGTSAIGRANKDN